MNGREHYREAERLLASTADIMAATQAAVQAGDLPADRTGDIALQAVVMAELAQGHAMLALADSQTPDDRRSDPSTGGELRTIGRDR